MHQYLNVILIILCNWYLISYVKQIELHYGASEQNKFHFVIFWYINKWNIILYTSRFEVTKFMCIYCGYDQRIIILQNIDFLRLKYSNYINMQTKWRAFRHDEHQNKFDGMWPNMPGLSNYHNWFLIVRFMLNEKKSGWGIVFFYRSI